ncbi:uncharacterized protein LOC119724099 [Patiria miniata]|uniref:Methyltransferase FkbM domain-containing protein n=1 Tax=Patiria miniata TaxID=46514 RepID=A0A913ZIQ1_PATMI|nr:uncharacterized protein LOC119724099 [Patiria miniata]XP_038050936.1 uncharacterized protein LOC119724099 [Patiria miniata]
MAPFQRSAVIYVIFGFCLGLMTSTLFGGSISYLGGCNQPVVSNTHIECKYPDSEVRALTVGEIAKLDSNPNLPPNNSDSINSVKPEVPERKPEEPEVKPEVSEHKAEVSEPEANARRTPRKILLDCGGNVASTVLLFRETYPGGQDYIIHSFEIDDRLSPYFKPYDNHHLHCPVGVAGQNGNLTAYSEMVWSPSKGLNHGADMQWGGGSLFVSSKEKQNEKTGGYRQLSYRKTIPVIDLSQWIVDNFSKDDYIIFKLDVEGAEYAILRKMIDNNVMAYIDKFYGEYHDWQPTGWSKADKAQIRTDIKKAGFSMIDWVGERRKYSDIEKMNPIKVPAGTPGEAGKVYTNCASGSVTLTVAVGMNYKRARRVVETLAAHKYNVPITLFVYGDFVQRNSEAVKTWSEHFNIGIREDGHNPPGHLELMPGAWVRMGLISSILRLEEIGITASYYLPTVQGDASTTILDEAKNRGLRVIKPVAEFPAKQGTPGELTWDNYYKNRDVERVPKALRKIHDALAKNTGGVLTVDSDLPDTYMNSVFMMDYLVETSGFKLVDLKDCVSHSR